MGNEFTHNHYVPEWYQRRFMEAGQNRYCYLDLTPDVVTNNGHSYTRRALHEWGPDSCFAKEHLYTTHWGGTPNVEIEKFFFGRVDSDGREAVEHFATAKPEDINGDLLQKLMNYMSIQKLRTPKGLAALTDMSKSESKEKTLLFLQQVQNIFCATWTECKWQIADASKSNTKLIISDHPVTVYNRACFLASDYCKGFRDPDIRLVGTHTYFPLSLNKVLILTNLAWVRNPYQLETTVRPNPALFRTAIFSMLDIQFYRSLSEDEVRMINFITKMRAYRYVASAKEDWLHPENYLVNRNWRNLGDGLLLMPEPRDVYMGGEITIGYKDGSADAFGPYGHKPWQKGFKDEKREKEESASLRRFKAEFAKKFGPAWRGTSMHFHQTGPETDSAEMYEHYLKEYELIGKKR